MQTYSKNAENQRKGENLENSREGQKITRQLLIRNYRDWKTME